MLEASTMPIYLIRDKNVYDVIGLKRAIQLFILVSLVIIFLSFGLTVAFSQNSELDYATKTGIGLSVGVALTFLVFFTLWKTKQWRFSLPKGAVLSSQGQNMIKSMRRP